MNATDLARIAANCRRFADLIEERGIAALDRAHTWQNTSGQWTAPPEPGDERSTSKLDRLDPLRHARLQAAFGRCNTAAQEGIWLLLDTVPNEPEKPPVDECPEGACRSCWRDNRYFEPEALHPDGRVKYRGVCRWCQGVHAMFGAWPPRRMLRTHHEGRRVSVPELVAAFKAEGRTINVKAS